MLKRNQHSTTVLLQEEFHLYYIYGVSFDQNVFRYEVYYMLLTHQHVKKRNVEMRMKNIFSLNFRPVQPT